MSNTFDCLKKSPHARFVFCSSTLANNYTHSYGVSKKYGEMITRELSGINVRFWNVYGNEEIGKKSHVVSDFLFSALTKKEINLITDGNETRQFIHSDDCARALLSIFKNFSSLVLHNNPIDISSGSWVKIRDIANIVKDIVDNKHTTTEIRYGTKSDTIHTILTEPNLSVISEYWKPSLSLEEGIRLMLSSHKQQPVSLFQPNEHILSTIIHDTLYGNGDSDKHLLSLYSFVLQGNAKRILELGVRKGKTTLPLLYGSFMTGGHVTSVDIEDTSFVCPESLLPHWTFVKNDAISFLTNYTSNEPWDVVYIDDWHSYDHVKKELELLDYQVGSSTLIVIHDLMYANYQPHYHTDIACSSGQWAKGGPYRAVAELNQNFWEFMTIPQNNGLTLLRKKYSGLKYK
jgi:predicted O-methyltransferase YrrM